MDKTAKIAASILAANFLELGEEIGAAERGGADRIHLDVMDGRFVPNISFGIPVLKASRRATGLPLEVHLMIVEPERYLADFAEAGADTLIVHQEVSPHLDRTLQAIKGLGKKAGVAINPATPVSTVLEVVEALDLLLVMTVNPGFGGQQFIGHTLQKIEQARRLIDDRNPSCELEVDGGIEVPTISAAYRAGARVFVAGTAVFGHPEGASGGVRALLEAVRMVG
jgi:ribulose-phosphate 3-epimerase